MRKLSRTRNMMCKILLTFLNVCLLVNALPSMLQNDKTVNDDKFHNSVNDESDNSSGKSDKYALPVVRHDGINERSSRLMGRKNDAPSKCGYEVRRPINQFNRNIAQLFNLSSRS